MLLKNGCVVLLLISCSLHGMSKEICSLKRSKISQSVPLLYPEISVDRRVKVIYIKEIEWKQDLKVALEHDDVATVKRFLEADFFELNEECLFFVYNNKCLNVMRYFLEKRLETYEQYSLKQKNNDNFFAFVKLHPFSSKNMNKEFDTFFQVFEDYFWDMRFFENVYKNNKTEIKEYNDYISASLIVIPCVKEVECYCDLIKKRFKGASWVHKSHILECAALFKHDVIPKMLHFQYSFEKLPTLKNARVTFV